MRLSSTQANAVTARKTIAADGMPITSPLPNQRTPSRLNSETGVLSLNHRARPRAIVNIASVAMNGTTRPKAIAPALMPPSRMPMASAPRMNATLPESASWPPATAAAATIEPTERSMPPVAITNVMPIASTPTTEAWRRTLSMLSEVRKVSGSRIAPTIRIRATTPTSAYSWLDPPARLR